MQKHWVIQNGIQQLDFVGRFENLKIDLRLLAKKCNFKLNDIPHKRRSRRDSDYRGFYTETTKDLVGKRFKEDIDFFGYEFK